MALIFAVRGTDHLLNVCEKNGIVVDEILVKLNMAESKDVNPSIDYNSWPMDLLATYIERTHHKYVVEKIPVITSILSPTV